jgi:hypothetical protein
LKGEWQPSFYPSIKKRGTTDFMPDFVWDPSQVLSMAGAVLVLYAFLALSLKKINPEGLLYAVLNFSGTGLLALSVLRPFNLGLFLVEAIWCLASFWLCLQAIRRKKYR